MKLYYFFFLVKTGDSWATFKWDKLSPSSESALYNDNTWTYRVSYSNSDNQFALHKQINLNNGDSKGSSITFNVTQLSPGSHYTFR